MQMEVCGLELFDAAADARMAADDVSASEARRLVGTSVHLARLWPSREVLFNTGLVMLRP